MNKEEILSHFKQVKKYGKGYTCLCPAHDDHKPSCSITFNEEWANIHCFVGCEKEDILLHAGLTKKDMYMGSNQNFPSSNVGNVSPPIKYEYRDEDNKLLYTKYVQYEAEVSSDAGKRKKKCWYQQPNGKKSLKDVKRVPFQLPLFKDAKIIIIVEGEKCATIVTEQGYVATTLDSGSNSKWNDEYLQYFGGKEILILPDNDEPGIKYAEMLKQRMPWAVIKKLPDLETSEDVYDWLQKGHSMEEIKDIEEYLSDDIEKDSKDKKTPSEILLELIERENIEIFLDDSNEPYVAVFINGHREIHPISSNDFSLWLQMLYYTKLKKTIRNDNLSQAINILNFKARVNGGKRKKLNNRVARLENDFWYDMTDENYSAIKISIDGWSLEKIPPILFCRYRHQVPQVLPQHGGDIDKIFEYVNLVKFKKLFICWLVSCFVPNIPHPMTILYGEKGAAKSTACELLKRLIDPSATDTLSLSRDEQSLIVNLQSHYYLPFDNVSAISRDTSDILCRAITGGAVQRRKLYTDADSHILKFKRCMTINGISNVANRSDLLDRSILLELERVSEDRRREQQEIYARFEQDRPYILGSILDVLSKAMAIYPTVKLNELPRMADFCRWGYAIGEAIGGYGDEFLNEYRDNQLLQNKELVDADIVAFLIFEFMKKKDKWCGLVSELLKAIGGEAPKHGINSNGNNIPQYPNQLSRRIKDIKSNLEGVGISYTFDRRKSDGTYITLYNKNLSPLSPYCVEN